MVRKIVFVINLLAVLGGLEVRGQGKVSVLKGKVFDKDGGVAHAQVCLYKGKHVITCQETNEDGEFRIENMQCGRYFVKIISQNSTLQKRVVLNADETEELIVSTDGTKYKPFRCDGELPPLFPPNDSPRRHTFDLQDIRRNPAR